MLQSLKNQSLIREATKNKLSPSLKETDIIKLAESKLLLIANSDEWEEF
jgi:hypothetical protein